MIISSQFVHVSAFFCLLGALFGQSGTVIRGQLASGQPGVYVTIPPASAGETVLVSALINGRRGSVVVPLTGDTYLPLETPLNAGDCVQIQQNRGATTSISPEECVADPFDFGRVRYYFTGGAIVSKDRDDFSKTDLFMSFSLDKNYLLSEHSRVRLNTYFDTRLTAMPVAEQQATTVDSFLATTKAAALQMGVYLPITTSEWRNRDADYSLFVAPLAKVGFMTPTDTSDPSIVNPNRFFTSYGFGGRLGHFREFKKDTGRAPELLSSIDIVVGRFGNFESYRDQTPILQAQHLLPRHTQPQDTSASGCPGSTWRECSSSRAPLF